MIQIDHTRFTLAVTLVLVALLAVSFYGRATLGGFVHGLGQTVLATGSGLPFLGTGKTLAEEMAGEVGQARMSLAEGSLAVASRPGR